MISKVFRTTVKCVLLAIACNAFLHSEFGFARQSVAAFAAASKNSKVIFHKQWLARRSMNENSEFYHQNPVLMENPDARVEVPIYGLRILEKEGIRYAEYTNYRAYKCDDYGKEYDRVTDWRCKRMSEGSYHDEILIFKLDKQAEVKDFTSSRYFSLRGKLVAATDATGVSLIQIFWSFDKVHAHGNLTKKFLGFNNLLFGVLFSKSNFFTALSFKRNDMVGGKKTKCVTSGSDTCNEVETLSKFLPNQ